MANEDKLIEMAEAYIAAVVDNGIRQSREGLRRAPPDGYDGTCQECGEDVPPARQALGFYNCVECQAAHEARQRQRL